MGNKKKNNTSRETGLDVKMRLESLRDLLPEAFEEGKIDWEKLRMTLGEEVDERPERYNFTWAGKRDAIRILQTPSRATLVPVEKESVNFETTKNLFIEGDNLEVLKLMLKPYYGRVKMIYIDPPYNTGNDFVYTDNYADPLSTYLKLTGQRDSNGDIQTSNPETSGRYHSAWLSMMYPRLFLARQLLSEDGVIFISIDDHEIHNLRMSMNEIFGEDNFIANVIWQKKYTRSNDARWFSDNHDYILVYARDVNAILFNLQPRTDEQNAAYSNPDNHPKGPWKATPLHAKSGIAKDFSYKFRNGVTWSPPAGTYPRYSEETLARFDYNDEIWFGKDGTAVPSHKTFLANVKQGVTPVTIWPFEEVGHNHEANSELKEILGEGIFENPKPTRLVNRMLELATSSNLGDIVLDFFAGSGTTGQAILEKNFEDGGNRRFILIQLPEPTGNPEFPTIADIGEERIRRVIKKLTEESGSKLKLVPSETPLDLGVRVFKLAESNYKPWTGVEDNDPNKYVEQLETFVDPLIIDWKTENVIYEVALKEGYCLNITISEVKGIGKNTVFMITDPEKGQSFQICMDKTLDKDTARELKLRKGDLFVCRDSALTDEIAANLALQCKLKTI